MTNGTSVAVIGAGAYGTAHWPMSPRARDARSCLYARSAVRPPRMIQTSRNNPRLPGIAAIDDGGHVRRRSDLVAGRARGYRILLAVPSQQSARRADIGSRRIAAAAALPVVACAKGIERMAPALLHDRGDRARSRRMHSPAILSGPNFADDVAQRLADGGDAWPAPMKRSRSSLCRRWARRRSVPTTPPMCAALRSAARPRTCWPSPPASSPAANLGASALAAH